MYFIFVVDLVAVCIIKMSVMARVELSLTATFVIRLHRN